MISNFREVVSHFADSKVIDDICEMLPFYCSGHQAIGVAVCVILKAKESGRFDKVFLKRLIQDEIDP